MIRFFKRIWDRIGLWILFLPFIIVPIASIIIGIVGTISELHPRQNHSDIVSYSDDYVEGYSAGWDDGYSAGWDDGKSEADLDRWDY